MVCELQKDRGLNLEKLSVSNFTGEILPGTARHLTTKTRTVLLPPASSDLKRSFQPNSKEAKNMLFYDTQKSIKH